MSGLAAEAPTSGARATTKVRIAGVVEKVKSLYFWLERNVAFGVEWQERRGQRSPDGFATEGGAQERERAPKPSFFNHAALPYTPSSEAPMSTTVAAPKKAPMARRPRSSP